MYDDLKGKAALVTGSGKKSGIGYAIAHKLAECGMNIVVADLGDTGGKGAIISTATGGEMEEVARSLERETGVKAFACACDITDTASVAGMAAFVKERFARLDVLCNNAGASFGVPNSFLGYDEAAWMKTIDVNLHGVFKTSRALLPLMLGAPASIINTASRAGKVPPIFNGAYAVAKAGVIMLSKVMAKELAGAGVRVNAVCPAQIDTELERWRFGLEAQVYNSTVEEREKEMCKTIPMGRLGTPGEVADLVAFLASKESAYLTGQAINICGGQLMEL
jgi:NAD(P)-dependent dehydrogenase (short-subunit alcohol dehydrogenase family)